MTFDRLKWPQMTSFTINDLSQSHLCITPQMILKVDRLKWPQTASSM